MLCLPDGAHDVLGVGSLGGVEREAVVDERLDAARRALRRRQTVAVKHARHDLGAQKPNRTSSSTDEYICALVRFFIRNPFCTASVEQLVLTLAMAHMHNITS